MAFASSSPGKRMQRSDARGAALRRLLIPAVATLLLLYTLSWTATLLPATTGTTGTSASATPPSSQQQPPRRDGPVASVLHPRTAALAPLTPGHKFETIAEAPVLTDGADIAESTEYFPQHGPQERGIHWRLKNQRVLRDPANYKDRDSVLVLLVLRDRDSWGPNRTSADLFKMLEGFEYDTRKLSLTLLVSDAAEFNAVRTLMHAHIHKFAQFSLLLRTDFDAQNGFNRGNRHANSVQNVRRRMLARYRNFALLSTLETWHQHVVWLDSDVIFVPNYLLAKMVNSGLDIVEPICYRGRDEHDLNAWVGTRTQPEDRNNRADFVPAGLHDSHLRDYRGKGKDFIELDSVGGTTLYVKADIHRQGVIFTHHYVIGSEWDAEGFDGIETEGLCYLAHFLGYKCWGMPNDVIQHALDA